MLLEAVVARPEALGPAVAPAVLPLTRALKPGAERARLMFNLLPVLLGIPSTAAATTAASLPTSPRSAVSAVVGGGRVVQCGSWRTRLQLASQLSDLAVCMGEPAAGGRGGAGGEGCGSTGSGLHLAAAARDVETFAEVLLQDPVWSVRKEAAKQLELMRSPGPQSSVNIDALVHGR